MNERKSARSVRLKKEVRVMFWPWCAVVIAGALPLLLPHSLAKTEPWSTISVLSFFFGVPLLATLSLGNEFHDRTLSLWLTQPFSRRQLWIEKTSVMFVAVLSAGLVSGIGLFFVLLPQLSLTLKMLAAAYVIITAALATFWTLTARSTIGGFVLIIGILYLFYLFIGQVIDPPHRGQAFAAFSSTPATITAIFVFSVAISGAMLWLGARKLARFEATGGSSGEDLLMAGSSLMPQALAGWFRCRPSGAFLNLIRKELRLLRPLWLISPLVVMYVSALAMFRLLPTPPRLFPETALEWALLGPLAAVCIAIAGLAGMLSLGEERASGTHAWHMTLPLSARRQWLSKLIVAMLAGLACALLFPVLAMIAVGSFLGSPFMYVDFHLLEDHLILLSILILLSFWCACAANGTVRAAIWTVPVTVAITVASAGGVLLGEDLARTAGTLTELVVSSFHLSPLAFTTVTEFARTGMLWLFVPTLLLALAQSYRLFRTQPDGSALGMLRSTLPLALVTILWSSSAYAGFVSSRWEPFREIRRALDQPPPVSVNSELTGEDLAERARLTEATRRWLKGSSIAVAPSHSPVRGYAATIHLASGLECRLTVVDSGGEAASCRD